MSMVRMCATATFGGIRGSVGPWGDLKGKGEEVDEKYAGGDTKSKSPSALKHNRVSVKGNLAFIIVSRRCAPRVEVDSRTVFRW